MRILWMMFVRLTYSETFFTKSCKLCIKNYLVSINCVVRIIGILSRTQFQSQLPVLKTDLLPIYHYENCRTVGRQGWPNYFLSKLSLLQKASQLFSVKIPGSFVMIFWTVVELQRFRWGIIAFCTSCLSLDWAQTYS